MSTAQDKAPRTKKRAHLSRERIIETAIIIFKSEGLKRLTMRRLAKELNTDAASLYWYFRKKDDLLDVMFAQIAKHTELTLPEADRSWDQRCKQLSLQVRDVLQEHPDMLQADEFKGMVSPFTMRLAGMYFEIFVDAGANDQQAMFASHTFVWLLISAIANMPEYQPPLEVLSQLGKAVGNNWSTVTTKRTLELASFYTDLSQEDFFEQMLDALTNGVGTLADL